jgi:N-acetylneuraminate synthase
MNNLDKDVMLIAEISGNHLGSITRAKELILAAHESGATHVKLQTYTPDTITLDIDSPEFTVSSGHSLWGDRTLYDLYKEAHTPWDWHAELFEFAKSHNISIFSTPFDPTAVDLLERLETPFYKIASLETGDTGLIAKISRLGKTIIASTGASTLDEIDELVSTVRNNGNPELILLLCTSAYPTPIDGVNLSRIATLKNRYNVPIGLSDHTLTLEASLAAVALGAVVIERHFTLARSDGGADSAFSLEPSEFQRLSHSITEVRSSLGSPHWSINPIESESRRFRRSLYVVEDVKKGDLVSETNVRSIRPANGAPPNLFLSFLGKKFAQDVAVGTPMSNHLIEL